MPLRIAFLYIYHAYHVYHSAPMAFELSRLDTDLEVHLFSTYNESTDLLIELSSLYPDHRVIIHRLSQPWPFRLLNAPRRAFPRPGRMVKRHARLFQNMDAIVDTNYVGLRLRNRFGVTTPKYIMVFHGAGDRQREFPKRLKQYDMFLLYGPKKHRRLNELGVLTESNWSTVGYPKFDVVPWEDSETELQFPEKRPVVLYNPHFEPHLSSWFAWGRDVLDFFARSSDYNLIFAPHVELKGRTERRLSLREYAALHNIHVDPGSRASMDMTYTRAADIYLGDVSSQICEFLTRPRPCIFLNSHKVSWESNTHYRHWKLGTVVDAVDQLENVLANAVGTHAQYLPAQIEYFNDSIDMKDTPSGLRAARAILAFMRRES